MSVKEQSTDFKLPEETVHFAVEAAADAAFWVDEDGRLLYVNRAACQSLGFKRAELLAMNMADIDPNFPKPSQPEVKPQTYNVTSHHLTADGRSIPVELSVIPFRREGRIWRWVFARDISKRIEAEAALRESQQLFKGAFQDAAVGMAIFDTQGRLLEANPYLCRMVGYTEAELRARPFIEITHPEDRAATIESDRRMMRGDFDQDWLEKRYVTREGRIVWVILSSSLVRDKAGRPRYFVSHVQDISQRKEVARELLESREFFRSAFEDAAVGMIIFNAQGVILEVNHFMCDKLDLTEEELKGKHYLDITHPEDFEISVGTDQRILKGEIPFASYEKRYLRRDGKPVWFTTSNSLLRDADGTPRFFVAHFQDITKHKEARQALRESERRFSLFMANMPGRAFIKDRTGTYVYANRFPLRSGPAGETGPGAEDEERSIVGLKDERLMSAEEAAQQRANDARVLSSGRPAQFIEQLWDGRRTRHWLTYKFPILQDDGSTLLGGVAVDITDRVEANLSLELKEQELEKQAQHLAQVNTALKVLLDHREQEKVAQEKAIAASLDRLVKPYLTRVGRAALDGEARNYLDIAASNLDKVTEPFAARLSGREARLTPTELKVADLLRHEKTSDQIAELMDLSPHTVARHRAAIRRKLGLTGQKVNLKSFLQSLD